MHYIDQVYTYFFPPTLSFQHLSDTTINIASYLSASDVCSLAFVEGYTFSVLTNSQGLAHKFANGIVKEKDINFVLERPEYILNNIRKLYWLHIDYPAQLEELLLKFPHLEKISFSTLTGSSMLNSKIFQKLPIQLKGFKYKASYKKQPFITELTRLTALKKLELFQCDVENEVFSPLFKSLTQLTNFNIAIQVSEKRELDDLFLYQKNLNKLNLSMSEKLDETGLHDYCLSSMTSLTNLTNLRLVLSSISELDPLNQLTRLYKLELISSYSNAEIQKVTQLTQLKHLSLTRTIMITNPACQAICQNFPQLESLDLSGSHVSDDEMDFFINLKKLKVLSINGCLVSDEKIDQLRKSGVRVNHS